MAKLPQINYSQGATQLQRVDTSAPARLHSQRLGIVDQVGNLANLMLESAAEHEAIEREV